MSDGGDDGAVSKPAKTLPSTYEGPREALIKAVQANDVRKCRDLIARRIDVDHQVWDVV